jgi:hypothetical protein
MPLTSASVCAGLCYRRNVHLVMALVALAGGGRVVPADEPTIRNASFESTERGTTCQAIDGWTLYGAPVSSISVVEEEQGPSLRISRGKAFAYGLPVDPATDYLLSVRVRATKAKVRIEAEPPLPDTRPVQELGTTIDWTTIEFPLLAANRPQGVREMWIALSAEATEAGGAAWFRSVRLEPLGGGPNSVRNGAFEQPVVQTPVPQDWVLESGGASLVLDPDEAHDGSRSLRVSGVGRPFRVSQPIDLAPLVAQGVKRVRISGWGRSRGLGSGRVRLEVYGSVPPVGPLLSLSGDAEWMKGEVILDVGRQEGRKLSVWIQAPQRFEGDAWFDDIRIEPVPDDEVVNLLANSSFEPSLANPRLPDFWGLWGDAVWCIEPWSLEYFGLVDVPGPFPDARVLQVVHPESKKFVPLPPNKRLNMYVLTGANLDLPKGDYTFSIYAKADRPNTNVVIGHPARTSPLATARVGRKWQRISATSSDAHFLPAIHVPDPSSRVWLSAPQLEPGRVATAYRSSPGNGSIAPPGQSQVAAIDDASRAYRADLEKSYVPVSPLAIYAEYDHVVDDENVRVRLEWTGTTPATVHWRLLNAVTGEELPTERQAMTVEGPGQRTFTISTAGLDPGAIGIHAVADAAGKRAGRATDVFAKLAKCDTDVRINRFSRSVTVDGVPILPIFLPIEPSNLADWHLNRLVKAGFNCLAAPPVKLSQRELMLGKVPPAKEAAIRRELDRLQARGMKLLWPIPWTFDDWSLTGALYRGQVAGLASVYRTLVKTFRDHPAILGWYLMDEPARQSWEKECGFTEAGLYELWFAVKQVDPGRFAYVNWNHSWDIAPYGGLDCTDVVGHDNYVISGEPFDYCGLAASVRMINDARAGRKPAFALISGSYDEVVMRPSVDAIRVHAWLQLLYGTRGLGFWSKPPLDPEAWVEINKFNREATLLHRHVLGDPDAKRLASGMHGTSTHHALWMIDGAAYLLLVNPGNDHDTIEIDIGRTCGREVVSGERMFDHRDVQLEEGVMRDQCASLSRSLYRFVLARPSP